MENIETSVERITVEVAYALPAHQRIITLQVIKGCTAFAAVVQSGIVQEFPEINLETAAMGIFSRQLDGKTLPQPKVYQLNAKDRVEIYRPLLLDPMQARLLRAARAKQKGLLQAQSEDAEE
jgi:putative ubiquitin-RnfH superfamily antitoxin RatB of RatAB toxin-antitoxin module